MNETAGYVEVRPGAHMFWLLQYSTHPDGYLNRPWIIWIQGGPGVSGTGFGNYVMFGPEDSEGNERPTSWVQSASIVYVDNPIGTGFSYLSNNLTLDEYGLTLEEISGDLVNFTQQFLQDHTEFQSMPLYIFGQSWGGKMGPAFAYFLEQAIQAGDIQCNLVGLGIGNGAVEEIDKYNCRAEMLYQMSLIDDRKRDALQHTLNDMRVALEADNEDDLEALYRDLQRELNFPISFYDITQDPATATSMYGYAVRVVLFAKMNDFRQKYDFIPEDVEYTDINFQVNSLANSENWFRSVDHWIDELLMSSTIQVIVYSGQYDVICCTSSQLAWIRRLTWPGLQTFHNKERIQIMNPNTHETDMFVKATDRLKFYWVMRSGHVVPLDVPDVALNMLNRILDNTDV